MALNKPKIEYDRDTCWVLEQLKREDRGSDISLPKEELLGSGSQVPSNRIQLKILRELEVLGAVSLQDSPISMEHLGTAKGYLGINNPSDSFLFVSLLHPKFDKIYAEKPQDRSTLKGDQ